MRRPDFQIVCQVNENRCRIGSKPRIAKFSRNPQIFVPVGHNEFAMTEIDAECWEWEELGAEILQVLVDQQVVLIRVAQVFVD
jgi:hypothetical protein